jgi:c-di-GMP-binding flagellar brake protein YcgR
MTLPLKRPQARAEKRESLRLDKVFPVWLESPEFGEMQGVARNISAGGMFIEAAEPMPLGAKIRIHFAVAESDAEIVAVAEVKNHYFLNFNQSQTEPRSMSGMGVRFLRFDEEGAQVLADSLVRLRVLH